MLSGRLSIHSANLDNEGCFDDIFRGCQGLCHVSHVSDYTDPNYMIRVCNHIIASINNSNSINRVIVTSSIAAVMSEADVQEFVKRPVFYTVIRTRKVPSASMIDIVVIRWER